jgi:hypothetical protein
LPETVDCTTPRSTVAVRRVVAESAEEEPIELTATPITIRQSSPRAQLCQPRRNDLRIDEI